MELNHKNAMRIRKELKNQIDHMSNKQFDELADKAALDPRTSL